MNWKEFIDKVKSNDLKSVYLFYGEEEYLIDYSVRFVKDYFIDENFESLNYVVLDGETIEFNRIIDACETLPFMSEKKIVIIKDFPYLLKSKPKSEGVREIDVNSLSNYMHKLDPYVCLIFTIKHEDINKLSSVYKAINKVGDIVEFKKLKGKDLNSWVEKKFNSFNKIISKPNISYFIQQSYYFDSNNKKTLYDLENEINKICNYKPEDKEVTKDHIDAIMSKSLEMNVFNLLTSIGNRNGETALKLFNEIYMANHPVLLILHMIVRQLRNMLNYRLLKEKGYSDNDINKKMNISTFEFQKVSSQSSNFTIDQLEKAMFYCLETDKNLKSSSMDERLALELLITNLCYKM